jgi:opacity protein-like surface antigen
MKKFLFMGLALLLSGSMMGQVSKTNTNGKSFIVLHGGPSFPLGDFASNDFTNNENAGLAKTGFTINLGYGYHIKKNMGIAAGLFYNNYPVDEASMEEIFNGSGINISLDMDHWKFYGIAAGPLFTLDLNKNIAADIKIMGGISNANSPNVSFMGEELVKGDWGAAATFLTGINLRIGTAKKLFFFGNIDFTYLDPKFEYEYMDENDNWVKEDIHQKMSVINVTAGVGMRL